MTQKHKHSIRCEVCGYRRRGKYHDEGTHHADVVKGKAKPRRR